MSKTAIYMSKINEEAPFYINENTSLHMSVYEPNKRFLLWKLEGRKASESKDVVINNHVLSTIFSVTGLF